MNKEKYGEVPEKEVPPDLLALGKETFDFCVKNYGTRPLRLRWLRKDATNHAFARLSDAARKLAREKMDHLEQGYEETEEVYGFVRNRAMSKEKSNSVFVAVETPISRIRQVVGHEFYHAQFSPSGFANEAEERAANAFGDRIEREMEEAAKKEAGEEWLRRFREIQKSQK